MRVPALAVVCAWHRTMLHARALSPSSLDGLRRIPDTFPMGVSEELRALGDVVDRLAAKFPALSREYIEDVVQQEHSLLDTGRVRAFVPVLVEHAARDRLSR